MKFQSVGKEIFFLAIYGQNAKSEFKPFIACVPDIFSENHGHLRARAGIYGQNKPIRVKPYSNKVFRTSQTIYGQTGMFF